MDEDTKIGLSMCLTQLDLSSSHLGLWHGRLQLNLTVTFDAICRVSNIHTFRRVILTF